MSTTNPTIATTAGGWHTATVTAQGQGNPHLYKIIWRTQRHQCCPTQAPLTFDGTGLPVYFDRSLGRWRSHTAQCGGCGSIKAASYSVEEV